MRFNDLWNKGYKAIFVAVGAHKSRPFDIAEVRTATVSSAGFHGSKKSILVGT